MLDLQNPIRLSNNLRLNLTQIANYSKQYTDFNYRTRDYIHILQALFFLQGKDYERIKVYKLIDDIVIGDKPDESLKYRTYNLFKNMNHLFMRKLGYEESHTDEEIQELHNNIYYLAVNLNDSGLLYSKKFSEGYNHIINSNIIKDFGVFPVHKEFLDFDNNQKEKIDMIYGTYNSMGVRTYRLIESNVLNRYVHTSEPKLFNEDKDREIISIEDTRAPMMLAENIKNNSSYECKLDDGIRFMNPNLAKMYNANRMEIDDILAILGESQEEVKTLCESVQNKRRNIIIVGLGGGMSNFVHWVERFMEFFRIDGTMFENVAVFEDDDLELSNLFRIPLDYITPIFIKDIQNKKNPKSLMMKNTKQFARNYVLVKNFINAYSDFENLNKSFDFYIGGPTLEAREIIRAKGKNFICPSHGNNDLYIHENPVTQNYEMMVETYGSVHLSYFFLNMVKMTIEVMKIIDRGTTEKDKLHIRYSAAEIDIAENLKNYNKTFIIV